MKILYSLQKLMGVVLFYALETWQAILSMTNGTLKKKEDIQEEAERIVIAAAKIIRAEIRERKYDSNSFPANEDISSVDKGREWIPHVITPTLFGIGVEMDHVFGSRWLVNELSRLGFSISYDEVNRYKQSVIQSESLDIMLAEYFPGTFTQWVADNVDHNVASLDVIVACMVWES